MIKNIIMSNKIVITKPSITELEINYVTDAISHGWGAKCYEYIHRFEKKFADFLGVKYSLATSSCTGAIHLALMALGVKAGDEVIIPDITWIASVEPVLYIGAKPIMVDILPDTWCIDPSKIESVITPNTKAIIVVHLYGNLVDMDAVMRIADKYNIKVLEDAAEAFGSEINGKKAGSIGHAGVFSFHGTKTISTGEGGMMVTNDERVYQNSVILNDHGRDPKIGKTFWMENYGYKYKISNLQAAMGCAQIERAQELIDKKREVFNWYKYELSEFPGILNPEYFGTKNSYWMPTLVMDDPFNRDSLFLYLKNKNIDSRPFFYPLSSLPMFESKYGNSVSYSIYPRGINLPSHSELTRSDVAYVCKSLRDFFEIKNSQ
jgi:perosamine synthetase